MVQIHSPRPLKKPLTKLLTRLRCRSVLLNRICSARSATKVRLGSGSQHRFKHGPAVCEYRTGRLRERKEAEPRFAAEDEADGAGSQSVLMTMKPSRMACVL